MEHMKSKPIDVFAKIKDAESLYRLADEMKSNGVMQEDIFKKISDFCQSIADEKAEIREAILTDLYNTGDAAGVNPDTFDLSHIDKNHFTEIQKLATELEASFAGSAPIVVFKTDEGYLQVDDAGEGQFKYKVFDENMVQKTEKSYNTHRNLSSYEVIKDICQRRGFKQPQIILNVKDFIEQARNVNQNPELLAAYDKQNLAKELSQIEFKHNILDCGRELVFDAYAKFCVDSISKGYDIRTIVETMHQAEHIKTKRDFDTFYKACVNNMIYNGTKFNKTVLYHNLDILDKVKKLDMVILAAQKAVEENIDSPRKMQIIPVDGYKAVNIIFTDANNKSISNRVELDEKKNSLGIMKQIFDEAAKMYETTNPDKSFRLALNAELVHSIYLETSKMPSAEKLETIKELFKDASVDVKERICNLYLGDSSQNLRHFLQKESVKLTEEKSKEQQQELSKKQQVHKTGMDI